MNKAVGAKRAGLIYVNDGEPGLSRRRNGAGFIYLDPNGRRVRDRRALARIRALAIPPAWNDVWICADPNGHLQATGRDARGRKQHRYHPDFRAAQEQSKFDRLAEFARALPALRAKIGRDMAKPGLPREKVLAAIVHLLDATLIRIGNDEYARANKSYGLTTLRDQHATIKGDEIRFVFTGKSGKSWRLRLRNRRVAKIIKAAQDLPGQRLFQYNAPDGTAQQVTSSDVNAYLREASGRGITAKDFRTWGGTVLAAAELARLGPPEAKTLARANIKQAVETVAGTLGNTIAVCRKCYIHPAVLESYEAGGLAMPRAGKTGLSALEASLLAFLASKSRKQTRRRRGGDPPAARRIATMRSPKRQPIAASDR